MQQKNIGIEKALQKIKHYCSYQERSHREVKEKLYGYGLYKNEVEELLAKLVEENYLNEERFAIAFATGKFRMRQWGKQKIKYEMKQRQLSDYCIKKGLAAIDEEEYERVFQKLSDAKRETLDPETNIFVKKQKLQSYLMQKGYEPRLIMSYLNKI